jgi:hypothetical protein
VAVAQAGIQLVHAVAEGHFPTSAAAASAAVTVPTALYLLTVWFPHSRHFRMGLAQRRVLPVAAVLVLCCTFPGDWAVLAAGIVTAPAAATGTTPTAPMISRESAAPATTG